MLITARFSSVCPCGKPIAAGDRISYVRGAPAKHAACSDEGKEVLAKVEKSRAAAPLAHVDVPCPEGLEFRPFQMAGMAFLLGRLAEGRGSLLADEMGLGKTVQVTGAINASPDIRTVLIVCPASLRLNWRNELRRWLTRDLSVGVFGYGAASLKGQRFDVTVVSYDVLSDVSVLSTGKTVADILDGAGVPLPKSGTWDLLVGDEIHKVKNPKTARGKAFAELRKRSKHLLALTGTPIPNKPVELFPILQMVDPEEWDPAGVVKGVAKAPGEGAGFFRFVKRYCNAHQEMVPGKGGGKLVWNFDGASDLEGLNERLRSTCMVRRLKKDVLKELPAKIRTIVPIGNGEDDEEEWGDLGNDYEEASRKVKSIPFTELSRTRHRQALKKVKPALEHIGAALEEGGEGHKVIVFAHHKDVIAKLVEGLSDYGVVSLVGDDTLQRRQDAVEKFQTDPKCRVFVGSLTAAGVGLTLTASSHVVFVEGDWVPATMTQAEDRAHRIGQRESVLIEILVLEGSLDAKMMRFVTDKQDIADMALDDETIESAEALAARADAQPKDWAAQPGKPTLPRLSDEEVASIHRDLRFLASGCDGAQTLDGQGFNKFDASFGRTLAALPKLSQRQAVAGKKMVHKYRRQLGKG
jgi:SWI/SNF-related matrix-associated actin-dependent regulator 1 of chromatin subfamily A